MKALLLHAWPPDERMWEPQLAPVREAGFEPVAPRLSGRGAAIDWWAAQLREEMVAQLRRDGVPNDLDSDVQAEELAVAQEAMRDRPDLGGVVASFGGPVLVCVGEADEIVSVEEARTIADSALDGSLDVFQGAGHLLSFELPDHLNVVLGALLGRWRT